MIKPTPESPNDTSIDVVDLSTRIHNALKFAGLKTIRDVRESSDRTLLSLQDLGPVSVKHPCNALGLPSCEGVWPVSGLMPLETSASTAFRIKVAAGQK